MKTRYDFEKAIEEPLDEALNTRQRGIGEL